MVPSVRMRYGVMSSEMSGNSVLSKRAIPSSLAVRSPSLAAAACARDEAGITSSGLARTPSDPTNV